MGKIKLINKKFNAVEPELKEKIRFIRWQEIFPPSTTRKLLQ